MSPIIGLLSWKRKFSHDEFEAVKSAWKLFSGERIYVDFFQHHHPFLYYLLTPLFSLFGESIAVIQTARLVILLFTFGIFLTTYKIAKLLFNKQVAAVSTLFLFSATMFVKKAIEVRPDVPMTYFGLLSILFLFTYFSSGRLLHLLLSALSLSIAFLFLQKIIFLVFFVHALLLWRIINGQLKPSQLLIFSVVFMAPWAIYCLFLLLTDQFSQYFFFNFTFNFPKLKQHHYQTGTLIAHVTTRYNGIVLVNLIFFPWTLKNREQSQFALLSCALLVTALLYGTQYAQYYLYIIPLLSVLAARGWEHLTKLQPGIARLILVLFLSFSFAVYLNDLMKKQNDRQLAKIDYVLKQTSEKDFVYDGDIRFNLFRRDLDFFWFGVGRNKSLDKFRMLTGYDYNVYELIDKFKPKIISRYAIDNFQHPVIRDHYLRSYYYRDLYLRTDDPAGKPGIVSNENTGK
ncbi:MAG: ArnT family glycosyltransferase [Gammaproteobacteria bacterium]